MGVIQRQGLKQSIAVLIGSIIGGANNIYFFTRAFEADQIGLIRLFQDVAILFTPFIILGASGLTVRFFPKFKKKSNGHNGFLRLLLTLVLIGLTFFLVVFLGFQEQITAFYKERSPLISQYYIYLIPVVIGYSVSAVLTQYSSNFHRLAVPVAISQGVKPLMTLVAISFIWQWIDFTQVVTAFTFWYLVGLGILLLYIKSLGQLHLGKIKGFIKKPLAKEMRTYAAYGMLASAGSTLLIKVDTLMLASINDLNDTGIYVISAYIASIIMIPTNALTNIASPIISKAFHDNDMHEVDMIYKKSSLNLTIVGLLFILLITTSIHDLFDFMPNGEKYQIGIPVVLILLAARFFDMLTSVNNEIIGYSKHFRMNFFTLLVAGFINIGLNYLLIPSFGILGPAIATAISLLFFNLFKLLYIYKKLGLMPFQQNILKAFAVAAFTYFLTYIPFETGYPLVNIFVKSTIISLVFVLLTIKWNVSADFNEMLLNFWRKLQRK